MTYKKSQTSIEFVILVGVLLFFFVAFFLALGESMQDKTKENMNKIIYEIVLSVQDEISLATKSIDGYYREFEIQENINNIEYAINIVEDMVYLKTTNGKYAIALPVLDVVGDVNKGVNVIEKRDGVVYLNP